MKDNPFLSEVTEADFNEMVVARSQEIPVLVDFWADWCQPCQVLMPMLEQLARDYQGAFFLAKVNADQEQALAARFQVRGLPTVKVFRRGQVVQELTGVQPESVYRQTIDTHRARPSDRIRAQAKALWSQNQHQAAVELLRQAAEQEPENMELRLELADALLGTGDVKQAAALVDKLPADVAVQEPVQRLQARLSLAELSVDAPPGEELQTRLETQPDDHEARRQLAARRVAEGNYDAALAQFLELMRRAPRFGDGAGRRGLVSVFSLLGEDDPLVKTYRRRMAALLY